MSAFVAGTGVDVFPNIMDEDAVIWREYGVGSQPAFVLKRADGSFEKFGSLGEDALQEKIDQTFG